MKNKHLATLVVLLLLPAAAMADSSVQKLDDNHYLITHEKLTRFGNKGKVTAMLHMKAASLCVIKGKKYFEPAGEAVKGQSVFKGARGSLQVRLHDTEVAGKETLECAPLADDEQITKIKKDLARIGDE